MYEPIAGAGWRAALWMGLEWRLTLGLGFFLVMSFLTKSLPWNIFALTVTVGLAIAFSRVAEDEPNFLDMWVQSNQYAGLEVPISHRTTPDNKTPNPMRL